MRPARVNIEIGELMLRGFDKVDGKEVGTSLQSELGRLLADGDWSPEQVQAASRATLSGGRINVPADADARGIGRQLARQIYQGMTGPAPAIASHGPTRAPGTADRSSEA
ncbi:MAG: hypothetical protein AAGL66_08040 [Pseudomonadota bacterium]